MKKVIKTYSVDPDLFEKVQKIAKLNAQTISGMISRSFENYIKDNRE